MLKPSACTAHVYIYCFCPLRKALAQNIRAMSYRDVTAYQSQC